jgi:hypothetical protein
MQAAEAIAITALGIPLVLPLGGRGAALASGAGDIAVRLSAHAFAGRIGGSAPPSAMALAPGALAGALIAGVHVLGLDGWSAGIGAVLFASAAPLLDRKLLPDLVWLGSARFDTSASDVVAENR